MAAAIEYGIDLKGEKVIANEADQKYTYVCPYCLDKIKVRKGDVKVAYFAHNTIDNRTPQQKICPGYKGGDGYADADKIYITNGGLPLYLCEENTGNYQLIAEFPALSKNTFNLLTQWDVKIHVKENQKVEARYSIFNIRYYRVKTSSPWIAVKVEGLNQKNEEVMRKWAVGIRGLNAENDLFHEYSLGGYRVALHSNIIVGKKYLFLSEDEPKFVCGIAFNKKGKISIEQRYTKRVYIVLSLAVQTVTNDAKAFIQRKGYQLIEASNEIIPVWPPTVIEGKTLIYKKKNNLAYLYHKKNSSQQIYNMDAQSSHKDSVSEEADIVKCSTQNMVILISDQEFNSLSGEIRYVITRNRDNYDKAKCITPQITCKNELGIDISLMDKNELMKQKRLSFFSNIDDLTVLAMRNKYILVSTHRNLDVNEVKDKLVILKGAFGKLKINAERNIHKAQNSQINLHGYIEKLYLCYSNYIPLPVFYDVLMAYAFKNSKELSTFLLSWKFKNQIPCEAAKILCQMKEELLHGK